MCIWVCSVLLLIDGARIESNGTQFLAHTVDLALHATKAGPEVNAQKTK